MRKTILILFFTIIGIASLLAQKSVLKGVISDKSSKEPLFAATVSIGNSVVLTDENGTYAFSLLPGDYEMQIKFIGYKTITTKVVLKSGQNLDLNFDLEEGNMLLETTTVTSGKYEKALSEVTVSLDILKPSLIESVNTSSLSTVLEKIPGVTIIDGQANIRGGSGYSNGAGSRVMLLVDDIPILQPDAGYPNWNDVPVENIEQIEVVKGAASALYGSAAMNGIINVRTGFAKSKPETKIASWGQLYLDPQNPDQKWWDTPRYTVGGSVLHKHKFNKVDFTISGFYLNRDSYNEYTYDKYGRITTGLRYRLTERLSIGLNANVNKGIGSYFFIWRGADSLAYRGDPSTQIASDKIRYNIDPYVTYFDNFGNRHKIMGRFYSVNNTVSGGKSNHSNLYYGEYQFQRNFNNINLVTTAGVVYTYTDTKAELYGDTTYVSKNVAGYLQLDKKLWERVNLSAGMRYEYNQQKSPEVIGNDTIPNGLITDARPIFRFGLSYQLMKYTFLRASWGEGYRFPTIAEKFINTNVSFQILANPKLTPETGWSTEFGIKQGFRLSGWEGFFDVAAFWSQYVNMLEFTAKPGTFAFQSQNIGNIDIKGIEMSITGQGNILGLPSTLMTGYTYIDPKYQSQADLEAAKTSSGENVLKYRYKHSFKADLETKINKFSIGLAVFYNSQMVNIDQYFDLFIKGVSSFRKDHPNGYKTLDIRVAYTINDHFKATFICGNVFNEEYSVRPALLEAPRNITLRLDANF